MDTIVLIKQENSNVGSITSLLNRSTIPFKIVDSPHNLPESYDKLILPGVSSFDSCIKSLKRNGFYNYLKSSDTIKNKKILGICAGAQVLFEGSEEGNEEGLGIFKGFVEKLKPEGRIKIPHLGWNHIKVNPLHPQLNLLAQVNLEKRFYFSHSYHFPQSDHTLAFVDYGCQFPVLISNEAVTAVQFHPEKSYNQGLQLLKNFCAL